MQRFEVTGGNGRGATVSQIQAALRAAGAARVRKRRAFGMSNQPYVATFAAADDIAARRACCTSRRRSWSACRPKRARRIAWPDNSFLFWGGRGSARHGGET